MTTINVKSKQIYDKGTRHSGECYGGVLASDGQGMAYLQVNGKTETLMYRDSPDAAPTAIVEDSYILSPVFAGEYLFWVEKRGQNWDIRSIAVQALNKDNCKIEQPFKHSGRPLMLRAVNQGKDAYLVWEERNGVKTRIRLGKINRQTISDVTEATDGSYNAYDPAIATTPGGSVYLIYGAFVDGTYQIYLQKYSKELRRIGEPIRVSNEPGAAVYPSIYPRQAGGVWISYTQFRPGLREEEDEYVNHFRRRAQHELFHDNSLVMAGVFDGSSLQSVVLSQAPSSIPVTMKVPGTQGGKHSQIIEDSQGRAHLLFFQHHDYDPAEAEKQEQIKRAVRIQQAAFNHPDICIATLHDKKWGTPTRLILQAHLESFLTFSVDKQSLSFAFTEDGRHTGWNVSGEWFDANSELAVGVMQIQLLGLDKPRYDLQTFYPFPGVQSSIEEPQVEGNHNGLLCVLGQTHTHTNRSICVRQGDKDPHFNYRFMQDVQHCRFGTTTDHGYNMWHTEMLLTNKLADYYYFPGEFVAFPAYEWTGSSVSHEGGPFGHVNPIMLEETGVLDIYTPVDRTCAGASLNKLWQTYAGRNIITVPHHVADSTHPFNWDFYNEDMIRVVEIFQDERGSCEQPGVPGVTNRLHKGDGHWILDALKSGKHFGFIAGGDHTGVALAGVFLTELTRTGLYEAFCNRSTFATSGMSLVLKFICNDQMMGSRVACEQATFTLAVAAAEEIRKVQIVRNGVEESTLVVNEKECDHTWSVNRTEVGEFWYVRLLMANGEIAISSPIWLE